MKSPFRLCLLSLLLLAARPGDGRCQGGALPPGPVPDAEGKTPYVPSPFPGVHAERLMACHAALRTLTAEILRALPDDSELLADLFQHRFCVSYRSAEMDMIEMEMWRRGDVTVQLVKQAFAHPATEDMQIYIALWLRHRPWMKPEEFLPLVRQSCTLYHTGRPGYTKAYAVQKTLAEFLCYWGEAQDKALISSCFVKCGVEAWMQEWLLNKLRERLELRAQGKPHGMPGWFFADAYSKRHTSIEPCTQTYQEWQAAPRKLDAGP